MRECESTTVVRRKVFLMRLIGSSKDLAKLVNTLAEPVFEFVSAELESKCTVSLQRLIDLLSCRLHLLL